MQASSDVQNDISCQREAIRTLAETSFGDRLFTVAGPHTWNNLPDAIRDSSLTFLTFTKLLNTICLFDCRGAFDF